MKTDNCDLMDKVNCLSTYAALPKKVTSKGIDEIIDIFGKGSKISLKALILTFTNQDILIMMMH